MPQHFKGTIGTREMYDWYVSRCPKHVDYNTYKAVVNLWGRLFVEYLLDGKDVDFYFGVSKLGVRKQWKPTYIDHNLSRIARKKVVMPNNHSEFYGAKINWFKSRVTFGVNGWYCKPMRALSRALADVMKTPGGHRRYVQIAISRTMPIKKFKKRFKL